VNVADIIIIIIVYYAKMAADKPIVNT